MKASQTPGRRAGRWLTALMLGVGALTAYAHAPLAAGTATTVLVNPQGDLSPAPNFGLVTNYDVGVDGGTVRVRGYTHATGNTLKGVQITVDAVVQPTLAAVLPNGGPWEYFITGLAPGSHTVVAQGVLADNTVEAESDPNDATFVERNDTATLPAAAFEIAPATQGASFKRLSRISIPGAFSTGATFSNSQSVTLGIDAVADGADLLTSLDVTNRDPLTDAIVSGPSTYPLGSVHSLTTNVAWTLPAGPDGVRVVAIQVTDNAAHQSVVYKRAIVLDTAGPDLALSGPVGGSFLGSQTFNVTGSATDTLSGVSTPITLTVQALDSMGNPTGTATTFSVTPASDGSFTQSVTVATDGAYRVTETASDNAGNSSSIQNDFTVASTPPTINITFPANNTYVTPPATITAIVTDPYFQSASISIDSVPVVTTVTSGPGTDQHTVTAAVPSTQGPHTAVVTATGLGGVTNTASVTFTVDTAPPNTTIFTPITLFKVPYGNVSFTGRVTDSLQLASWTLTLQNTGLGTAPITVAGGSVSGTSANVSATIPQADFQDANGNPSPGPYQLILQATDAAGKTDPTPATINFTVDVPPISTITTPTSGEVVSGILVVRGHITEDTQLAQWELFLDGTRIQKNVDGGTSTDLSVPVDTHTLTDGSHTLLLTATDYLGQVGSSSVTFTVDNTAPVITFTAPAANAYVSSPVTFTATIADASPVSWILLIDGVQVASGTGTTVSSTQTVAPGRHKVEVRATDSAATVGNTSHAFRTFYVSGAGPVVTITLPTDNALVHRTVPFQATVTGANPLSTWVLTDNGNEALISGTVIASGTVSGTTATITYALDTTLLSNGTHVLTLTVTDAAGNSSSDSVTIRVDNTVPTVDITVGPASKLHLHKTATVTLTFNDDSNIDGIDLSNISIRIHQGGVGGKGGSLGKIVRFFAFGGLVDPNSGDHLPRLVSSGTQGQLSLPFNTPKFAAGNYTVEVLGVRDSAGNVMGTTTYTFHVSK